MNTPESIFTLQRRLLYALLPAVVMGCAPPQQATSVSGDKLVGKLLLEQYDCGSCHVIPGVRRAQGTLGPDLQAFSRRAYIAGEIPNDPALLRSWINDPPKLVPDTLMPSQQVPLQHAEDMGAYLMSLR
jgi:cytochrome c